MAAPLRFMRAGFTDRIITASWWIQVAFRLPRWLVVVLLALVPVVVIPLVIILAPADLGLAMTEPRIVRDTFSRTVPALVTASTVAVSVATLALSRQLKGVGSVQEHRESDIDLRERIRESLEADTLPLALNAVAARALASVADRAQRAANELPPRALDDEIDGMSLRSYLETVEDNAARRARQLDLAHNDPARMLHAALNFELELTSQMARRFIRRAQRHHDDATAEALGTLHARLSDFVVVRNYLQTLAFQWSLSRMSTFILVATLPAVGVAFGMAFAYGDGIRQLWGVAGASLVLALAVAAVLVPMGIFVSYLVRFLFVNEHTLPTSGFVLGPEAAGVGALKRKKWWRRGRRARSRGAGGA